MNIVRSVVTFCVLATAASSSLAQFTLNFTVTSPGEVQLGFVSEAGYYYCLESAANLNAGFTAASGWLRGDGTSIAWPVHYGIQQSTGGTGNPVFTGKIFSLYPFANNKTLVTWSDGATGQYNALVEQNYTMLPPLLNVSESNAGPSLLLLVGRLDWNAAYENLTVGNLPPSQQSELSNFIDRQSDIITAATNGSAGTGVSTNSEKQFFRLRRMEADSDHDNLDWAVEMFELGSDPNDPSDGLFPPVEVSTWFDPATGVDVSWKSAVNGTEGFKVERRLDGATDWMLVASIASGGKTWHDANVAPTVVYGYRIKAVRGAHVSAPSSEAIAASALDSDGDSMPDWWEVRYGLLRFDPTDATANPDGDSLLNLDEYYNDRNPQAWDDPVTGAWGPAGRNGGENPDPEVLQYLETLEPLESPSGLTYQVIPSGQPDVPPTIQLSWMDNCARETNYLIQFSMHRSPTSSIMNIDDSTWSNFAEVSANTTSYEWLGDFNGPSIVPQLAQIKEYRVIAARHLTESTLQSAPSNVVSTGSPIIMMVLSKPRDSSIDAGQVRVRFAGHELIISDSDLVDYGAAVGSKIAWKTAPCVYGDTFTFDGSISTEAAFTFSSNIQIFGGPSFTQNVVNVVNVAGVAQSGPERIRASVAPNAGLLTVPDAGGLLRPLMVYPNTQVHLELLDGRGNPWTPALPSSEVRWYSITRQGWNTWSAWKEIGRATTITTSFSDPGVFHVLAVFGVPNMAIQDEATRDAGFFYYGIASNKSCHYNRIEDESKVPPGGTRPKGSRPWRPSSRRGGSAPSSRRAASSRICTARCPAAPG